MTAQVLEFKADTVKDAIRELGGAIDGIGSWVMDENRLKLCHADGDINLNVFIKWAVSLDYGPTNNAIVDCEAMAERWSYSLVNSRGKNKQLTLEASDVLRVVLVLVEKGWFSYPETTQHIQLSLLPFN